MLKKLFSFIILINAWQAVQAAALPNQPNTSEDEILAQMMSGLSVNMPYEAFMRLYNISSGNFRATRTVTISSNDIALAKALSASLDENNRANNVDTEFAKAVAASLAESNKPKVKKDDRAELEIAMAISMHDLKLSDEEREEALLENFKKAKLKAEAKKAEKRDEVQKKECAICYNEIEHCQLLSCGHNEFHSDCIKKWIASSMAQGGNATCPICRKHISLA